MQVPAASNFSRSHEVKTDLVGGRILERRWTKHVEVVRTGLPCQTDWIVSTSLKNVPEDPKILFQKLPLQACLSIPEYAEYVSNHRPCVWCWVLLSKAPWEWKEPWPQPSPCPRTAWSTWGWQLTSLTLKFSTMWQNWHQYSLSSLLCDPSLVGHRGCLLSHQSFMLLCFEDLTLALKTLLVHKRDTHDLAKINLQSFLSRNSIYAELMSRVGVKCGFWLKMAMESCSPHLRNVTALSPHPQCVCIHLRACADQETTVWV